MEFIWRPHFSHQGRKSELFTHVFYNFDTSPFDLDVQDPPQNSTDQYAIDKNEWDGYWTNETGWDDWWFSNDTYDNDTDVDEEFDWWNWGNDTDTSDWEWTNGDDF